MAITANRLGFLSNKTRAMDTFAGAAPCARPAGARKRGKATMSNERAGKNRGASDAGEAALLKLEEFLPYRLNVCATLVSLALSRIYAERYKIGTSEWRVLVTLGQFGMMTGKAIGLHSTMHKTKVSRAVAVLEKRKLLARRANRADMREAFLSLTPTGREIYSEAAPEALNFARELIDVVDPTDRPALQRALSKLTERAIKLTSELAKGSGQR
jgi:DNA-binding MarR family transcriptional regulator